MRIAGLLTTCGEPFTHAALASLVPHVDLVIAVVDDRAPAGFAESLGVEWHPFTFRDDFAAIPNFGMDLLRDRCDFALQLDADETLDGGANLRRVVDFFGARDEAAVIQIPRRHWHDLSRTHECQNPLWFPDWQPRLRRPHIRMERRIHPVPVVDITKIARSSVCVLEHFNLATRTEDDWRRITAYYEKLDAMPPVQSAM